MTLVVNVPEYRQLEDLAHLCLETVTMNQGGLFLEMESRINERQWLAGLSKIVGSDTVIHILREYQRKPWMPPVKLKVQKNYEPVKERLPCVSVPT